MQQISSKLVLIIVHKKMMIIIVEIIGIIEIIIGGMIIKMIDVMIEGVMMMKGNIEKEILRDKTNKTVINRITLNIIIEMI